MKRDIAKADIDAIIFDMDGVVTQTADIHRKAWKIMFDEFLQENYPEHKAFTSEEYYKYIDGIPRMDGIRNYLAAKEIEIPEGSPSDDAEAHTVFGIAKKKNQVFHTLLKQEKVQIYDDAVNLLILCKQDGIKTGLITSSKNGQTIIERAEIKDFFDTIADGITSEENHLKGKPEPDIFLYAAKKLDVAPSRSVVIEDAIAGVKAGKAGNFRYTIALNREGKNEQLENNDADMTLENLSELNII